MTGSDRSVVTLRIAGDLLDPAEVTSLLKFSPTSAQKKGDVHIGDKNGQRYVRNIGMWRLRAEDSSSMNLNVQFMNILDRLPSDPTIWDDLASRFKIDFFCGIFMGKWNEGIVLSPKVVAELGERGIQLSLDIYGPDEDDTSIEPTINNPYI